MIGWTAWARRMVSGPASDRPMWRILPSVTSSASAPDRLLDRRVRIDPVLVVEVDVVGTEPPERSLEGGADVGRGAVEVARTTASVGEHAELGGQHHLVAATPDGPADEFLVGERPVDLGGVDQRHPQIERTVDGADGLVVVRAGSGVGGGHAHGAEADSGNRQTAQIDVLHDFCSLFVHRRRTSEGAVVFGIGDVGSPIGLRLRVVTDAFGDGDVGHEAIGGGTVRVPFVRGVKTMSPGRISVIPPPGTGPAPLPR